MRYQHRKELETVTSVGEVVKLFLSKQYVGFWNCKLILEGILKDLALIYSIAVTDGLQ